jgi:FAD/FMN-containing dehydrogenase/Fe-S oxidoreductase
MHTSLLQIRTESSSNISATPPPKQWDGDAQKLERALRERLAGEVRFDDGSRALYATDASNYRQVPIGVVIPRDRNDVIETLALCREAHAPILARGGGTSLAGQCCNVAVVLDFSKYMNRILEINKEERWARVEPGVVLDRLRAEASKVGLTFGPDPATHSNCTLGGMIGNDSCGVHSVISGRTVDNVHELEVALYDGTVLRTGATSEQELEQIIVEGGRRGQIYGGLRDIRDRYATLVRERFPNIPRRVSGYALDSLLPENNFHVARALVGSECTLAIVLEAKLKLITNPEFKTLVVLGYDNVYSAGDHVPEVMKFKPIGLEGIDDQLTSFMKSKHPNMRDLPLLPEGGGWLLVEFGSASSQEDADTQARAMMDSLRTQPNAPSMKFYDDRREEKMVWEIRESGLGATAFVPGKKWAWEGWEDSAVDPNRIGRYLHDLRKVMTRYGYNSAMYGHFGQGCVHMRIDFDLASQEGIEKYRAFIQEAAQLCVSYGGSLSGEHGDGQSRAELLPIMYGDELVRGFQEFKAIWDPAWMMNPGKLVKAYRVDENLRLGADYHPWEPQTHFKFRDEEGKFSNAVLRCVGVGKCRREEGATMCPSYRVTMEEMHSTRGRAHLLWEMVKGDVIRDGWKSEAVHEALDLCLACKGCKGDCPVNVDLATYKAEFLSHYYEHKLRPRHAYGFGYVDILAAVASRVPGLANIATQTPGLSSVMKAAAGLAQERSIPPIASQSFQEWFRSRRARPRGGRRVLLWPDTFNNYFTPGTGKAAVEVLEHAGFDVVVPTQRMCCGRPLYDFGMLDRAKSLLRRTFDVIGPELARGTEIVGLEPSCVAVFRDEAVNLLPNDERAHQAKAQVLNFSEFLMRHADEFEWPQMQRRAVVHGHCHQKAVSTMRSEEQALTRIGMKFELPNNGCCGLAGSFGFEAEKYALSMRIADKELTPHLLAAEDETFVVANGFSCREQAKQASDREALHLAEVMQMALHEGPSGPLGRPEAEIVERRRRDVLGTIRNSSVLLAASALVGLAAYWFLRRR